MAEAKAEKTLGVVILAIVDVAGGILVVFGGIRFLALHAVITETTWSWSLSGIFVVFEAFILTPELIFSILKILEIAVGWDFGMEMAGLESLAMFCMSFGSYSEAYRWQKAT